MDFFFLFDFTFWCITFQFPGGSGFHCSKKHSQHLVVIVKVSKSFPKRPFFLNPPSKIKCLNHSSPQTIVLKLEKTVGKKVHNFFDFLNLHFGVYFFHFLVGHALIFSKKHIYDLVVMLELSKSFPKRPNFFNRPSKIMCLNHFSPQTIVLN